MKALILVADGFEDLTLFVPLFRLKEDGFGVTLASPTMCGLTGVHGHRIDPDVPVYEVSPGEYDLLVIPGGPAAEKLRVREEVVALVRTFAQDGRIAALGHGPQLLVSAGALDGRTVTCSPGIRDDVRAAGASYRDEAVVVDGNFVTCRQADDLPAFCRELTRTFRPARSW